jgi:hypothetical protein
MAGRSVAGGPVAGAGPASGASVETARSCPATDVPGSASLVESSQVTRISTPTMITAISTPTTTGIDQRGLEDGGAAREPWADSRSTW